MAGRAAQPTSPEVWKETEDLLRLHIETNPMYRSRDDLFFPGDWVSEEEGEGWQRGKTEGSETGKGSSYTVGGARLGPRGHWNR